MNKLLSAVFLVFYFIVPSFTLAGYRFSDFQGRPPIHTFGGVGKIPTGITPSQIKKIYHLPESGGHGTIAIIGAYEDPSIESDLHDFNRQFNLPECTIQNSCFEKHKISSGVKFDNDWAMETTLDVEWAHAIAPKAKILLVEATTPSGANFLKAIQYATSRSDVVSISMSWGGAEFPEETTLDSYFKSQYGAVFFASSGDNGTGASWPAASPWVIGVGGTTLSLNHDGSVKKEIAWSGSGGGISIYEKQPQYQIDYSITKSNGFRAIPDIAYDADPASGFPIIRGGLWRTVGGTSAGSPQWAAIATLGKGVENKNFYTDKASVNSQLYFTDIISGKNGACGYVCQARKRYDYVTGLGSPLTVNF
ncbi:S53 family peptidase [Candidatus Azambacteria bacterium]|nr:S53 family peptidase [Candidatus Azambacteria bacterium]